MALKFSDNESGTLTHVHDMVCAMWHAKGFKKSPNRQTVAAVLAKSTLIRKVDDNVYEFNSDSEDEPTPEDLMEWTVQRHVGALSCMHMPLVPERIATEIRVLLARMSFDETNEDEWLSVLGKLQKLAIEYSEGWQGFKNVGALTIDIVFNQNTCYFDFSFFEKASNDELDQWAKKIEGIVQCSDFTADRRSTRIYDIARLNSADAMGKLQKEGFHKLYQYFYVKTLKKKIYDAPIDINWSPTHDTKEGESVLPPFGAGKQLHAVLSALFDFGATGLQTKRGNDFTRKGTNGALFVCESTCLNFCLLIQGLLPPRREPNYYFRDN